MPSPFNSTGASCSAVCIAMVVNIFNLNPPRSLRDSPSLSSLSRRKRGEGAGGWVIPKKQPSPLVNFRISIRINQVKNLKVKFSGEVLYIFINNSWCEISSLRYAHLPKSAKIYC